MKRRRKTEPEFDLEHIRKLKRLAKRLVRGLEDAEKHLVKFRKADQQRPSKTAVEAAMEFYGLDKNDVEGGGE